MIRLVLSKGKLKNTIALFLAAIMIVQLLSGMDMTMIAEAATSDYYSITGSISYNGDSDWKDVIRPKEFDTSKIEVQVFTVDSSGGTWFSPLTLQETNADGQGHLAFIHDGCGGGSFTISNIPKVVGSSPIKGCYIRIKDVNFYNNVTSPTINFNEETGMAESNAVLSLSPKTVPMQLTTSTIGEEGTSTAYDINIIATNKTNQNEVKNSNYTKSYCVSSTGKTIALPIGLQYSISQEDKKGYTLISYNLSYTNSSNVNTVLQNDVTNLTSFTAASTINSNTVSKYILSTKNAAKNQRVEWELNWKDNYSSSRPSAPSFKLQYSLTEDSGYTDITTSNMATLDLTSVPSFKKVANNAASNDDTERYYYEDLPKTTIDGKTIYYKVVQTTNSSDYMYKVDRSGAIAKFTNTL